jgi:transcriptional regulator with XRE-family HTH domain
MVYKSSMLPQKPSDESHLVRLRQQAGLTVRELARQLGTSHTNVMYWERAGKVAKSEFLPSIAKALGVTIDEVLGEPRPRKTIIAGGKMGKLFEAASQLPRRQQEKIIAVLEPFINEHRNP